MSEDLTNKSFSRSNSLSFFPTLAHVVSGKSFGNVSLKGLDEYGDIHDVFRRRREIASFLGVQETNMVFMDQVHGDQVSVLGREDLGAYMTISQTDAIISNLKGVALVVTTADCVPILLYDNRKKVIGVVHAGWRGTVAHIVEKTIEKMVSVFGVDVGNISAFLGPSIGPCCYGVGNEVLQSALRAGIRAIDSTSCRMDLGNANRDQLVHAGILERNIECSTICTSCQNDEYFSYRKDGDKTGRFASALALVKKGEYIFQEE